MPDKDFLMGYRWGLYALAIGGLAKIVFWIGAAILVWQLVL